MNSSTIQLLVIGGLAVAVIYFIKKTANKTTAPSITDLIAGLPAGQSTVDLNGGFNPSMYSKQNIPVANHIYNTTPTPSIAAGDSILISQGAAQLKNWPWQGLTDWWYGAPSPNVNQPLLNGIPSTPPMFPSNSQGVNGGGGAGMPQAFDSLGGLALVGGSSGWTGNGALIG